MKTLAEFPPARADRHATLLAHAEPNCRVVFFTLGPGQEVPLHTSPSTVVVTVTAGSGTFIGADTREDLIEGATAVYAPNESHGMVAGEGGLRFVAIITPSPA